jgi:hypothetical protein
MRIWPFWERFIMSLSLAEALQHVDLQPGQTYREKVNGHTVEVRVLDDTPTPDLADQVMLESWVEFPFRAVGKLTAQQGPPQLPAPFVLDESDLVPE